MSDLEELKRLHAEAKADEPLADEVFLAVMIDNFPAIVARLEAQERALQNCLYATTRKADRETALADAVRRFCKEGGVEPQILRGAPSTRSSNET